MRPRGASTTTWRTRLPSARSPYRSPASTCRYHRREDRATNSTRTRMDSTDRRARRGEDGGGSTGATLPTPGRVGGDALGQRPHHRVDERGQEQVAEGGQGAGADHRLPGGQVEDPQ